jgi:hypothetical protein
LKFQISDFQSLVQATQHFFALLDFAPCREILLAPHSTFGVPLFFGICILSFCPGFAFEIFLAGLGRT